VKALAKAGLTISAAVTLIGLFARWFPALDIVNNGLPFLLAGTVIVVVLATAARSGLLTVLALLLTIINSTHFVLALEDGAHDAAPGAKRFLRVVSGIPMTGSRTSPKFLSDTDADLVVMQEMTSDHWSKLRKILGSPYPNSLGDYRLVILSKYNITEDGRVDRGGMPPWASLILRFGTIEVNGCT
jgi:hypothetical protein